MTKKDFKRLASAISTLSSDEERAKMVDLIGTVCAEINPRFDWNRWRLACNGKPYKK